jgi:hypothetical protein
MGRDGPISGEYTGDRHFTGYCSFDQGVGGAGLIMKKDTQIWYVDSGKTNPAASGNGTSPAEAFITLKEAVDVAGNYDVILVAQNAIETIATAGITITQTGLRILGSNGHPGRQAGALKKTVGTTPMFIIGADRVEIAGLNLSMRTAGTCIEIGTDTQATTAAGVYSTYIHDCNFDGYDTALYAIEPNDSSFVVDPVNLVVENCFFKGHVTAAVLLNGTRDTVHNCFFDVGADNTGIYIENTTGDRNYTLIYDNMFIGQAGTTTKAIDAAGNNTVGTLGIFRNLLVGDFDTTIASNSGDPGCLNYQASTTGGSLIDCNSSA